MARTRACNDTDVSKAIPRVTSENENLGPVDAQDNSTVVPPSKSKNNGQKREASSAGRTRVEKKRKTPNPPDNGQDHADEPRKPRLTTRDLEFDFARDQLRDPRSTPGRKVRPRYDKYDLPEELKTHLEECREIVKPTKPSGRLNNFQKKELFKEEARLNPLESFHDLHCCYDKGREGSPTYDSAGFQLDYDKVAAWMRPQAYNKKKMVRNAERGVSKAKSETEQMFELFFGKVPDDPDHIAHTIKHYVKDHVSKDLGIPWHQITPNHVKIWRDQGHQPLEFEKWWEKPTAEESRRMTKMMSGASLRKDL
jgi:hypothetical protein